MTQKKLAVADFPYDPPEKVKVAFRNNHKTRAAARILMDALFDIVANIDDVDPWKKAKKLCPEVDEFTMENTHLVISYNHMREQFLIAVRNSG